MLSNRGIIAAREAGLLDISPWSDAALQPCSYDLSVGSAITINGVSDDMARWGNTLPLVPNKLYLLTTRETVTLSEWISGRVEGRSSWGRRGLLIHFTAGFIDAGFSGEITLEVCNLGNNFLVIQPGERIAQITFTRLETAADPAYGDPRLGSKYQGQRGPTAAREEIRR